MGQIFEKIHGFVTLACRKCDWNKTVVLNCGHRTCPDCRKRWFCRHYYPLLDVVKEWPRVYFMTLTMRNIEGDLQNADIKRLRGYFAKLRKRYSWDIQGGFYVIQDTNNGNGNHLHLHILYDGYFISAKALSAAWKKITGTSFIVDIRRAQSSGRAVGYILGDFLKAPKIRPEDYEAYDRAFRGVRVIQGFGHCRNRKLFKRGVCPKCGEVGSIYEVKRFPGSSDRFDYNCEESEGP